MRCLLLMLALPLLTAAEDAPRLVPTPLGDPSQWVTPEDYPLRAMIDSRVGVSRFRLDVDATGAVTACTITGPSGTAELDETTCRLMRERARFTPPRDATGKPAASHYLNRVKWALPDTEPFSPAERITEFDLDTEGKVTNCIARDLIVEREIPKLCEILSEDALEMVRATVPVHVRIRHSVVVEPLPKSK